MDVNHRPSLLDIHGELIVRTTSYLLDEERQAIPFVTIKRRQLSQNSDRMIRAITEPLVSATSRIFDNMP